MAPAPERWLELAIVVEQSRSTPLWQDTLAELKLLTERQGAFRRVSTWQIQMQGHGPVLNPKWRQGDNPQPACNPKTLIDPAGRRLIWLVSDCTSALWQQPQIYQWLKDWGKQCPTALVQLFPGRLWWRTALGDGVPVRLSAYTPGVPNAQLQVSEVLPFSELAQALGNQPGQIMQAFHKFQQKTLATVPVVSLEAYPLNQWARVMAGGGDVYTPGYSFNEATLQAYRERKQATPTSRQLAPKERVQQFQKTASETAFKLAGLMAAAPVSPPIIQLIQQTLLPESQQVHVAEVYMSGLLRAITPAEAKLPPHKIQYDFLNDEIRECLTDYVPIAKTEAVLDAVSAYISERLGLQVKTYEVLLLLDLEGRPKDQEVVLPFACIAKRALRRLGSDYAELADYIDAPDRPHIPVPPQPPKDFPELKTFEFEYPLISFEEETQEETESIADAFDPTLPTFDFETVRVNAAGRVIERIQDRARYFKESLVENILSSALRPVSVFMVYSLRDESFMDELSVHLANLRRQGLIDPWHIQAVEAGAEWEVTLRQQLEAAQIVLLLVSAGLLVSDFAYDVELQRVLERHSEGQTTVIPIILRPVLWQDTPFAKLQVLPREGRPITEWETRDDAFRSVTQGIQFIAEQIQKDQQGVSLDMVAIPGGTFLMGSPKDEIGHEDNEEPQHEVTVQPFFMSKTPITQAQWRAVAELDPVERELAPDPARFKGDDRPVENVSWHDATEFCVRLSRLSGRDYRLPTEAEWEYACRAVPSPPTPLPEGEGSLYPPFAFGDTLTDELANYRASSTFEDEPKGQHRQKTTPVGTFPPNAFGLYDMHGNVWEWCQDHWHDNYEGDPPTDGSAWLFPDEEESSDRTRVLRGGSWADYPRYCRSACRLSNDPDARNYVNGFRVVCSAA